MKQVAVRINGHLHAYRWAGHYEVAAVHDAICVHAVYEGRFPENVAAALCDQVVKCDLDVVEGPKGVRHG
jgi:hypothetical protein